MEGNRNIGFANLKYSLESILIKDVIGRGDMSFPYYQQGFILILHPRVFHMVSCDFRQFSLLGSEFMKIDLNRQYFMPLNLDDDPNEDADYTEQETEIRNQNEQTNGATLEEEEEYISYFQKSHLQFQRNDSLTQGEIYSVTVENSAFREILSLNISKQESSSVLFISTEQNIRIFIIGCVFENNTIEASENFFGQRQLTQVSIEGANSRTFLSDNRFLRGSYIVPFSFTVESVYFYVVSRNVFFERNVIESYSYFRNECETIDLPGERSVFVSGGRLEGRYIFINSTLFNATCTNGQPTLYVKLFEKNVVIMTNTRFKDLYSKKSGAGLLFDGVQNQVKIFLRNIQVNRMYSPSSTSDGFLSLTNFMPDSFISIEKMDALDAYALHGALLRSESDRINISIKDFTIRNSFDSAQVAEYRRLKKEYDGLKVANFTYTIQSQPQTYNQQPFFIPINNCFQEQLEYQLDADLSGLNPPLLDKVKALGSKLRQLVKIVRENDPGQLIVIKQANLVYMQGVEVTNFEIVSCSSVIIDISNVTQTNITGLKLHHNSIGPINLLKISQTQFIFSNSTIHDNHYSGDFLLSVLGLLSDQNYFSHILFDNNRCSMSSFCFSGMLLRDSIIHLSNVNVTNTLGRNRIGGIYYSYTLDTQANIHFSQLLIQSNNGSNIGGMSLQISSNINVNFNTSLIFNNTGLNCGGLALKMASPNAVNFEDTAVTNNTSQLVGGILIVQASTQQLHQSSKKFVSHNFPNQISSGPRLFALTQIPNEISHNENKLIQTDTTSAQSTPILISTSQPQYEFKRISEKLYEIDSFNSGDNLPSFNVKLLDENNELVTYIDVSNDHVKIHLSSESQATKGAFLKLPEATESKLSSLSTINNKLHRYDPLIGYTFEQIEVYGPPGTIVEIVFDLLDIHFENSDSLTTFGTSNATYNFIIQLHMRNCIKGQFIKDTLITTECEQCPKQYYSLLDPHLFPQTKCNKCPENASCPGSNTLILDSGYWRDSTESDLVIKCIFSTGNCFGGASVGDQSCLYNRIGPLCETCDIRKGFTDLSENQCLDCTQRWKVILIIMFILLFFSLYIFISIDSTVSRIKKNHILFEFSSANNIGQTSMLVKQFVSYLQILSIISAFRIDLRLQSIQSTIDTIGNPIIGFFNVVNCFTYPISQKYHYPHIYASFTVSLLIPVSLSLIVLVVQQIVNRKNHYYRKYYLITMMLVNFFYFTPLLAERAMQLLACRRIGDKLYVSASMIYECNNPAYLTMNMYHLFPLLFIILVVIPFLIIFKVRRRFVLRLPLKIYQYMLGDFKREYFYWEFVRFFTKIALVSVPSIFSEDLRTMGQVLNLILVAYYGSVFYLQPYWTEICHRMELLSGAAIFLSFQFCLLSFDKDTFSAWWWITSLVLTLVNIPLICWYMLSFFNAYKPSLNRFFSFSRRRVSDEKDDPHARVRLLWQLALFSVREQIKKEKHYLFQEQQRLCLNKRARDLILRDSQIMQRVDSKDSDPKKSYLLWWRRRKSNNPSSDSTKLTQQLISSISTNQPSRRISYNPYHDFHFSFLPQEK